MGPSIHRVGAASKIEVAQLVRVFDDLASSGLVALAARLDFSSAAPGSNENIKIRLPYLLRLPRQIEVTFAIGLKTKPRRCGADRVRDITVRHMPVVLLDHPVSAWPRFLPTTCSGAPAITASEA